MRNLAWRVCNAKKVLVSKSYALDELVLSNSLSIDVQFEADCHPGALLAFSFAGFKYTNADSLLVAGRSSQKGKCWLSFAFQFYIHLTKGRNLAGLSFVMKACGPINDEQDALLYIELYTIPISHEPLAIL